LLPGAYAFDKFVGIVSQLHYDLEPADGYVLNIVFVCFSFYVIKEFFSPSDVMSHQWLMSLVVKLGTNVSIFYVSNSW